MTMLKERLIAAILRAIAQTQAEERALIVAWLREERPDSTAYRTITWIADAIERGEHEKKAEPEGPAE